MNKETNTIHIKIVSKKPDSQALGDASEFISKGNHLYKLGRYEEALSFYEKAIVLRPDNAQVRFNRGNVLKKMRRWNDAIESYNQAIAIDAHQAKFFLNRANTYRDLRHFTKALESYNRAIALQPDYVDAYVNKGVVLRDLKRTKEALECYDKAISFNPKSINALLNRANVLRGIQRLDEALQDYDRALVLNRTVDYLEGLRQHTRMMLCEWRDYEASTKNLAERVRNGERAAVPFCLLGLPSTAEEQLECAKVFAKQQFPPLPSLWEGEIYQHKKIRIAYLSADFYKHATAYLMAGVFELHDKSKFETIALSFGPDDRSEIRHRLVNAFNEFIDVRTMSDEQVSSLIREKEIDIIIDLKGFTGSARTNILARRAAPIQINFLGYPGTMGVPYIDYIIADPVLIPEDQQTAYSEKIIWLPDTYQPNDRYRVISPLTPAKSEVGLPEKGFVFCSFNNNFKITPSIFNVWMRLLKNVKNSVLWLYEPSPTAAENLRREAEQHGVNQDRLIFAPFTSLENHLARHKLADLFLDTLPCNAHTTASDALWAGLPVLTCAGQTFASRVAASLLSAADMPELITHSLEEYEKLAFKLATKPNALAALKSKLVQNLENCALFDTESYTLHLEDAYAQIWKRYQQGQKPENININK